MLGERFFRSSKSSKPSGPSTLEPRPVITLDRTIAASVDTILENALDWEHLPHLHSQTYSAIRLLDSNDKGWRARVEAAGGRGQTSEIQLSIERQALRFVTKTLIGAGAGTQITTQLSAVNDYRTEIHVDFFLPPVEPQWMTKVAEAYKLLHEQMWDQDEAMMMRLGQVQERAMASAREAAFPWARTSARDDRKCLGSRAELESRLPIDLEVGGRPVRIVSVDGELLVFDTQCPHRGGPVEVANSCEGKCRWHGYSFDLRGGSSTDGRGLALEPPPHLEIEAATSLVYISSPARG